MNGKSSMLLGIVLLFGLVGVVRAGLFEDLSELKRICDAELLTVDECRQRRQKILDKYDTQEDVIDWFCNYGGEPDAPQAYKGQDSHSFSQFASASAIVKEILDEAGLAPNFIVRPANVANAAARMQRRPSGGYVRFIEYNPSFVAQLRAGTSTNWAVYSVMAHEIGHHLQNHTIQPGGSRPAMEIEADEYSGFILARLKATLEMAQVAMTLFGSNETTSGTHPPKNARLAAIERGWKRGWNRGSDSQDPKPPIPDPTPRPGPVPPPPIIYTHACTINGEGVLIAQDGAVVSRTQGYIQVGKRIQSMDPRCAFMLVNNVGAYCVSPNGAVYFGTPSPVGQCQPCQGNMCN